MGVFFSSVSTEEMKISFLLLLPCLLLLPFNVSGRQNRNKIYKKLKKLEIGFAGLTSNFFYQDEYSVPQCSESPKWCPKYCSNQTGLSDEGTYLGSFGGTPIYRTGPFSSKDPVVESKKFNDFPFAFDRSDSLLRDVENMILYGFDDTTNSATYITATGSSGSAECGGNGDKSESGSCFNAYPQSLPESQCQLGWITGRENQQNSNTGFLAKLYFFWKC